MGLKGDKLTHGSVATVDSLVSQLGSIGGIAVKKMFGGHGVFHDGKMFGIVDAKGQAYLKVDESNKKDFEKLSAHQHSRMPYYSIPDEILVDQKLLVAWAKKSIAISK